MVRDDVRPDQAREFYKREPSRTARFALGEFRCPDERCGEGAVKMAVPHPDDPEQTPNRCPTCFGTVSAVASDEERAK